jgi:hypothetical protein
MGYKSMPTPGRSANTQKFSLKKQYIYIYIYIYKKKKEEGRIISSKFGNINLPLETKIGPRFEIRGKSSNHI